MKKVVYRWECSDGSSSFTGANRRKADYGYVFITMKSSLMWLRNLGWGYDNPKHKDLVLCLYEAEECYPATHDIGTPDKPHPSMTNDIDRFCGEYYAKISNRTPIAYMAYDDIKTFGKQLDKCKTQKAIKEFLGFPAKYKLQEDEVLISHEPVVWTRYTRGSIVLTCKEV